MAGLAPLRPDREITAAVSSQISDGAGELQRTGGRFGLQTMCEGGGQANATIIERV
jgi:Thiolase, C-terminal domain